MSQSLDKILALRCVSLFADVPDEVLKRLALHLDDVGVSGGQLVFAAGDPGTAMFIVASGSVRVHDGDRTLDMLSKWGVFGEMAALDPAPRSASVTAVEETRLYRLEQRSLLAVMSDEPQLAQGFIHILTSRLRNRLQDMSQDYQYMRQFSRVMAAAAAVEAGQYEPQMLDEVAQRSDQLGQLARVFQGMVREVDAREQRLKQQVAQLRIEIDEAKSQRKVEEITSTDYFRQLQSRAKDLRGLVAQSG